MDTYLIYSNLSIHLPNERLPARVGDIIENGISTFGGGLVHGGTSWYKTQGKDEGL